ncbi:MAG: twin-arginine translocase TatA/TatE family subunit [Kiritimatiellae bacterium]|nr:twin-arginine translocase TatA/TatE family subunit [Kiritimatiellia bacterium]
MLYSPSVAFLTGSVGTGEWIVLFVVVLIVVGPKRLPEIARKIGRTMEMFRRAADEFKEQLMSIDQEPRAPSASSSVPDDYAEPYPGEADYPGSEDHTAGFENSADDNSSVDEAAAQAEETSEKPKTPEVGA